MRRRLFNTISVLSLVLFMVTAALWVRSYWAWDRLIISIERLDPRPTRDGLELHSSRGALALRWDGWARTDGRAERLYFVTPAGIKYTRREAEDLIWTRRASWRPTFLNKLGFFCSHQSATQFKPGVEHNVLALRVPHWWLVLLTFLVPLRWLMILRRQFNRAKRGLCSSCGYDMRATPERCPECGAVPTGYKGES